MECKDKHEPEFIAIRLCQLPRTEMVVKTFDKLCIQYSSNHSELILMFNIHESKPNHEKIPSAFNRSIFDCKHSLLSFFCLFLSNEEKDECI